MGITKTPSGLTYAALDIPQITQRMEGAMPPSFTMSSLNAISSVAAFSIWFAPSFISKAHQLPFSTKIRRFQGRRSNAQAQPLTTHTRARDRRNAASPPASHGLSDYMEIYLLCFQNRYLYYTVRFRITLMIFILFYLPDCFYIRYRSPYKRRFLIP